MKLSKIQAKIIEELASADADTLRVAYSPNLGYHLKNDKADRDQTYLVTRYNTNAVDSLMKKGLIDGGGSLSIKGAMYWFHATTTELLYHKYMYYELDQPIISDYQYDQIETRWFNVGLSLGFDMDNYPHWVGFDHNHSLAKEAFKLAKKKKKK